MYDLDFLQNETLPALIELIELRTSEIGLDDILIHGEYNEDDPDGIVRWNNLEFHPHSLSITGFKKTSQGTLPRVSLSISNVEPLPNSTSNMSSLAFSNEQLLKVPVVRYQVWREDLDTTTAGFAFDEYRIIGIENDDSLRTTFTLATAVDLPSLKLPLEIIDRRKFPSLPPS